MTNNTNIDKKSDKELVLNKAVLNAADILGITQETLARIIGLSPTSISRMKKGSSIIKETQKEWQLAVAFIRVYRSLVGVLGNDEKAMKSWLLNENKHFKGQKPINLIQDALGIGEVINYLDWARGH